MPKIPGDYQYRAFKSGPIPQRFWHANKLWLLDLIGNFSKIDIVLDAGCGSGNTTFYLSDRVERVVGVDQSQQAITFASSLVKNSSPEKINFVRSDLENLPFKKNSFSKIILFEVVEHLTLSQYKKIIKELYRILKPGGSLYLTTPNLFSPWPLLEKFLDFFRLVPSLEEQHILKLTPKKISQMVNQNGFQIKEMGTMNHFSPWLSLVSWKLAQKVFLGEIKKLRRFGPIIWLTAEKI